MNDTRQTVPCIGLSLRKAAVLLNKGKNSRVIKPIAEPAPCILEASVILALDSFTLNKPDKIPAPIANTATEINVSIANAVDIFLISAKRRQAIKSKNDPNHTSQAL